MPSTESRTGRTAERPETPMSANLAIVHRYLDGFRRTDHDKILACLGDDIEWTVFGAFTVRGKAAYRAAIEGPEFAGDPEIDVVRMVEQNGTVMAELAGRVPRPDGTIQHLSMAEVFVLRDGLIRERRAWVIPVTPGEVER